MSNFIFLSINPSIINVNYITLGVCDIMQLTLIIVSSSGVEDRIGHLWNQRHERSVSYHFFDDRYKCIKEEVTFPHSTTYHTNSSSVDCDDIVLNLSLCTRLAMLRKLREHFPEQAKQKTCSPLKLCSRSWLVLCRFYHEHIAFSHYSVIPVLIHFLL